MEEEKLRKGGLKVQACSARDVLDSMLKIILTLLYIIVKVANGVHPELSSQGKQCFSISSVLYLYKTMDAQSTYYDNHFMTYASQIIILYSLN